MTNHVHGRPDNQEENLDDILGRGKGDPDMHGYPGEPKYIGEDKPQIQHHYQVQGRGEGYPWAEGIDYDAALDEDQEDGHVAE